jgi:hypothetical protein
MTDHFVKPLADSYRTHVQWGFVRAHGVGHTLGEPR